MPVYADLWKAAVYLQKWKLNMTEEFEYEVCRGVTIIKQKGGNLVEVVDDEDMGDKIRSQGYSDCDMDEHGESIDERIDGIRYLFGPMDDESFAKTCSFIMGVLASRCD
jgi:hypothetical protein